MLILGAKGFAKELFEVCSQLDDCENLAFYDDVSDDLPDFLFEKFQILNTLNEAENYFKNIDDRFILGLGNPFLRKKLAEKFSDIGGTLHSVISPKANIGNQQISIGQGSTILSGAHITSSASIGKGLLMYPNSIITHDCMLGDFVDLSPGATLLGNCTLGSCITVGANATILPGVKVGSTVQIGAGAVITKDIPDNCLVFGSPARIIKRINTFKY